MLRRPGQGNTGGVLAQEGGEEHRVGEGRGRRGQKGGRASKTRCQVTSPQRRDG